MPIDISSYGQQPPPPDLVGTLGAAATIQNQLNQNRLFGQQFQSNVALSQAAKQSVDANGNFDPNAYRAAVASGPAGYMLPQAIEQSQQIQQGQNTISQQQIDLAKNHLSGLITNYLTPLAQNPASNSKDVATAIGHAITTGVSDTPTATAIWSTLPRDPQGNIIEAQVPTWIKQQMVRALDAQQQLNAMSPAPTSVSTGGQTQFIRTPQIGAPSVAGTIANTLPPTTPTVGPGNVPQALGPTSSTLQVPGAPPPVVPPATAASPSPAASPLAASMPGVSGNGPAGPQAAQNAPSGPVQTGLAPGVADAMGHQAVANADQGVALQKASDAVPQQKAILGNLETALNQFTPGPGASWTKETAALMNRGLQTLGFKGVAATPVAAQEEFTKQAVNLAQAQFATLGGTGTDAKLDSTMHTSPNEALSKLGNQKIISLLKGNADAITAKNQEWQKYIAPGSGHTPADYGQFSTQFNKEYDPRVFQSTYMNPADRAAMVKSMSKPEQSQFRQAYNLAVDKGWIRDPRQNGAQ